MQYFEHAKATFHDFIKKYDLSNGMIQLKVEHTYGVIECSEYIAKSLKLSDEDIELAKLIALLHDIARFEQATKYNDYRDYKTLDHADLAVQILFQENLIRQFINNDTYDKIIDRAIKNHNKLTIEKGLTKRELLHAKIIRDADKLDNFRVKLNEKFENICNISQEKLENSEISEHIFQNFMKNKVIISQERKTEMDIWVSYLAFIFDFNFQVSLKLVKEMNYINLLIDRIDYKNIETKKKMEQIRIHASHFLSYTLTI